MLFRSRCECPPPPKLTDDEKDIIWKSDGCFKCRKLYVKPGHNASMCPNDFPPPDSYKLLTWDYANKVKASRALHLANSNSSSSKPVANVADVTTSTSAAITELDMSNDDNFMH